MEGREWGGERETALGISTHLPPCEPGSLSCEFFCMLHACRLPSSQWFLCLHLPSRHKSTRVTDVSVCVQLCMGSVI